MTNKGIGFNRHVFLPWLDSAAATCIGWNDPVQIRNYLEAMLAGQVQGAETRRKAIDILLNIWLKTKTGVPGLWRDAQDMYPATSPEERIWLHFGLTLVAYPFVRDCLQMIGQFGRSGSTFTKIVLRDRLIAGHGQLGSLERSLRYVLASLRQWQVIEESGQKHVYQARLQVFAASHDEIQSWLLACALHAHPSEEIPFADLIRLPELFPFRLTINLDHLRSDRRFVVQRQGAGWDMVRSNSVPLQIS